MSRVIFHSILFRNFQSYGNYDTIISLDKNNLTLIRGQNGSGKSCILNALSYNLFGKPISKALKASLINNKNKKDLYTECSFSIGDDNYIIKRGEKPSILGVSKNGKELEVDGDSREFQKKLETEILRFDVKTFTRLICLGYDYVRFFELTSSERREFIEGVLDFGAISSMVSQIKEYSKKDSDELVKYGLLLNGSQRTKEALDKQLELLNLDNKAQKVELDTKITTLNDINKQLNLQIVSHDEEYSSLNTTKSTYTEDVKKFSNEKQNIMQLGQKINSQIQDKKKLQEFLNTHDKCPTCSQNISPEFISSQIELLNKEINKLESQKKELSIDYENKKKLEDTAQAEVDKLSKELNELFGVMSSKKTEYKNNDRNITEYTSMRAKLENNTNISELKSSIEREVSSINEYNSKSVKLQKRLEIYKSTLEILSETGVKKAILNNYIDIINQKVNEYISQFECSFSFEMDSEFNEDIKLDFHDSVKYENLSAGQKQRLDLSIFLAFREIAQLRSKVSANILLMDEILDTNLDDDGVSQIIDILSRQGNINIFAISHRDVMDKFDNIIYIEKEKFGFSRIKS